MSTLKANAVTGATTNSNLALTGNGTGIVTLGDGNLTFPDADGSANQVIKTNGSGALSFTTLTTGASDAEKTNIMLNSFRLAIGGGISFQNMIDGVVDEFEDETGVDTATSTNETYDATNDLYGGFANTSASGEFTDGTGNFSFSGSTITCGTGNKAMRGTSTANDLSGSFTLTWTNGSATSAGGHNVIGVYDVAENGTYSESSQEGALGSMTNSWWVKRGGDIKYGGSVQDTYSANNTSVNKLERVGSEIKFYKDGALEHTFTQTSTATLRIVVGSGTTGEILTSVSWSGGVKLNMTLFSNATTALSAPNDANIVIWQQDGDSITLNTDLKAYASRNGGTTYTQMTLAEVANLTTGRILTGAVDISGQSSATAMKYKIETLNTKEQKIHAVALQWS